MKKTIRNKLAFSASAVFLAALLAPAGKMGLARAAGIVTFFACLLLLTAWLLDKRVVWERRNLFYDLILAALLSQDFFCRLQVSSRIKSVAEALHLPLSLFLWAASAGLGLLSLYAINTLRSMLICALRDKMGSKAWGKRVLRAMHILFIVFLQFLMLEYGAADSLSSILQRTPSVYLANLVLLFLTNLLLVLVLQKWRLSLLISSAVFALWSVADYYTIVFHGSPLYLSEFANVPTAANVALQYSYHLSGPVVCILLLLACAIHFILTHRTALDLPKPVGTTILRRFSALAVFAALSVPSYLWAVSGIRPWMPWDVAIDQGGFLACIVEDARHRLDPIEKPDGYEPSKLPENGVILPAAQADYPDIILIVNETFCDLRDYTALETDRNIMAGFYEIEGAHFGKAVASNVGGGTNNTEFELLTGKSMYLLKAMAPFTYLDDEVLKRSTVGFLAELGYSTAGMHCERGQNYSRDRAYPALGFQTVILGPDAFTHAESNGNRKWLDSGNYADMLECYDRMGEAPRFVYLLTFQNHGGYEQNDAALDTVHVQGDYGDLQDDLDEFLSSMELSAEAFQELTTQLSGTNRKVILCMVGDHTPSFIMDLPARKDVSPDEKEILKRTVPFVIWTNYDLDLSGYDEKASMVDLMPMIMDAAGLPLTPFFQTILRLHEAIPIRTSTGLYRDAEGNYGTFSEDDPNYELLKQYYFMEYNSLLAGDSYRRDLFELR